MAVDLYLSGGVAAKDSIGGAKQAVKVPSRLFGPFSEAQFAAGGDYYRLVYVETTVAKNGLKIIINAETPSAETTVAIGWAAAGINTVEAAVANENTAPPGVTFASPSTEEAAVSGGDFAAGDWRGLWIRYSIAPTTTKLLEQFKLASAGTDVVIGPELWVDPATLTGVSGHVDYADGTYTINRNAGGQGSFASIAEFTQGVQYTLRFDFALTGSETAFAIDIRAAGGTQIHQDLSPTAGAKEITFVMPVTGTIEFTLPDVGWSATYSNISIKAATTSASFTIGREELAAGIAAAPLHGLQPAPVPFTAGAAWVATNMERMENGGIRGTALGSVCHASIDGGPAVGSHHSWQIRDPADATNIKIAWCLTGNPVTGTGYAIEFSRASIGVPWNISLLKIGTGTLAPSFISRVNPNTQRWTGSTSLTGVIPSSEARFAVRTGASDTKAWASIDWGTDESIYIETTDTTQRGSVTGVATFTPSGEQPHFQARMGLPTYSVGRPRRLTSPTVITVGPTTNVAAILGVNVDGIQRTGDGEAHVFDSTPDLILQGDGTNVLTIPLNIYCRGNVRMRGFKAVMVTQPGNDAAGGLDMNNGLPAIRPRLPGSGGAVRISNPYDFTIEGSHIDCAGHTADGFVIRGENEDQNFAFMAANRDFRTINCLIEGWRNDHDSAGGGLHGDLAQPQVTVVRNVLHERTLIRHWGSGGVWENVGTSIGQPGYWPGAQNIVWRNFDHKKDMRYGPGHVMYHPDDEAWVPFVSASALNLQLYETNHMNLPKGNSDDPNVIAGNFGVSWMLSYDAANSDPAAGLYKFGAPAANAYWGQAAGTESVIPQQIVYGSDRAEPIVLEEHIGLNYATPFYDDH